MDGNSFFQRWKQIGGAPRESQVVFKTESQQGINIESVRNILAGYRFGLLNDVDPNPNNFVGAGVVHGGKAGKVGALLRLEPNMEQHVSSLANIIILFGHFIPCLLNHSTFRCID
jgi:AP-2 complex subunit alpha